MVKINETMVRREIRSPRSAALAGIGYAILMITGMIMITSIANTKLEEITAEVLEAWSGKASLLILMVPFAGIALLWFTGVVRDLMGEQEDRLFSTLFLSSGIIQVVLLFIWGAIFGSLMVARTVTAIGLIHGDIYIFSFALMNEIIGNYGLRIAGIYMTAIASLWRKTDLIPRWLTLITYLLAFGFLVAAERVREARFLFPIWVLVVSVYILIVNFRRTHDKEAEAIEK